MEEVQVVGAEEGRQEGEVREDSCQHQLERRGHLWDQPSHRGLVIISRYVY